MNYPQRLATIITEDIETFYLTNQRQTKQELQKWIHHETKLVNCTLPPEEALPLVNIRTVNIPAQCHRSAIFTCVTLPGRGQK